MNESKVVSKLIIKKVVHLESYKIVFYLVARSCRFLEKFSDISVVGTSFSTIVALFTVAL